MKLIVILIIAIYITAITVHSVMTSSDLYMNPRGEINDKRYYIIRANTDIKLFRYYRDWTHKYDAESLNSFLLRSERANFIIEEAVKDKVYSLYLSLRLESDEKFKLESFVKGKVFHLGDYSSYEVASCLIDYAEDIKKILIQDIKKRRFIK